MKVKAVTNSQIYWASAFVGLSWVAAAVALALLNVALVWRLLIGLVPMAFLAWQLYLAFRYSQNQDEVMKRITLEALSLSFLISLPLIFLIGYIMKAGVGLPLSFMDAGYVLEVIRNHRLYHRLAALQMNNKLRVLRAERDWTQEDLAQRLGVSRQAIIAIEKGKYDPSLSLAFKMSKVFALPIDSIFDSSQE